MEAKVVCLISEQMSPNVLNGTPVEWPARCLLHDQETNLDIFKSDIAS